jgi:hypothetical protein
MAAVAESGNIREQLAFLYNGYTSRLFESLNEKKSRSARMVEEGARGA